jgi:small redox-active disulfide protein 2
MALFGNKKEASRRNSNEDSTEDTKATSANGVTIKVLGSGCKKCNALEAATKEALEILGMDATIDHVTDFSQIAAYGVMSTPALVINDEVVSFGKVLKTDEIITILHKTRYC